MRLSFTVSLISVKSIVTKAKAEGLGYCNHLQPWPCVILVLSERFKNAVDRISISELTLTFPSPISSVATYFSPRLGWQLPMPLNAWSVQYFIYNNPTIYLDWTSGELFQKYFFFRNVRLKVVRQQQQQLSCSSGSVWVKIKIHSRVLMMMIMMLMKRTAGAAASTWKDVF